MLWSKRAKAIEKEILALRDRVALDKRIKVASPAWADAVARCEALRKELAIELRTKKEKRTWDKRARVWRWKRQNTA